MSVDIDLDLDAHNATGKIGAIVASLKGLERVANDIDIDFNADVGEITDEINEFADALKDIDVGNISFLDELDRSTKRLENALDGEIDLNVGSGNEGGNNRDGTIPPDLVHNLTEIGGESTDKAADAASAADGGERANLLDRNYGPDNTLATNDFLADWLHKPKAGKTGLIGPAEEGEEFHTRRLASLGTNDPDFSPSYQIQRVGTRTGFGLDPESMNLRRMASDLSMTDFMEAANPDHGASGGAPRFEDLIRDFRQITLDEGELIREQERLFKDASSPINTPFGDNGLNFDKRMSELTADELNDLMQNPTQSGSGFRTGSGGDGDIYEAFGLDRDKGFFGNLNKGTDKLSSKLRKLKPTMGKYMQLLAALIPVAVALGTQLLGVAAAMGSVAVAGGAIMGLGLLGHGESFAGSMAEAKQRLREMKLELYDMAQPTMQEFAPIQARAFDAIPGALSPIFEEMQGFTAFEDTLFELGAALAGGMEEAVAIINENEQAISQLATRFGGLIGAGLLDFFEWIIQAASKNQELLVNLGRDMLKLAVVAYNLSMAIAVVLSNFSPLFTLLVYISELLKSDLIIQIISLIAWLFVFGKIAVIIGTLASAFTTLAGGIATAVGIMTAYTLSTWQAYAATAALLGLVTGGLALVGGALGLGVGAAKVPNGIGSGSGGGEYSNLGGSDGRKIIHNDNRSFEINNNGGSDYASQKSIEDTVKKVGETEKAQSFPKVRPGSETSDGRNN